MLLSERVPAATWPQTVSTLLQAEGHLDSAKHHAAVAAKELGKAGKAAASDAKGRAAATAEDAKSASKSAASSVKGAVKHAAHEVQVGCWPGC